MNSVKIQDGSHGFPISEIMAVLIAKAELRNKKSKQKYFIVLGQLEHELSHVFNIAWN
jgi:hypothetical protein